MALVPGGIRPRFGGAPGGVPVPTSVPMPVPSNGNGNGAPNGANGTSHGGGGPVVAEAPKPAAPKEDTIVNGASGGGGLAAFLLTEMEMPEDTDDADFDDEMLRLSHKVHSLLVDELGGQQFNSNDRERLRPVAQQVMNDVLKDEKPLMPKRKAVLLEEVLNEVLGFGPMQYLLNDPTISEIMVNSPTDIFIERKGKICRSRRKFVDEAHVMNIVDRIVRPLGKTANARTPMVDGRLPDGSRVNIVIPPLALNGPSMSIRKFFKKKLDSEALVTFGSMTEGMRLFLEAAVKARMNIIIAGGTGSGKTTTLNITSNFIPNGERVVTIEDAAELQVFVPNLVRLESRPKNIEGEGEVSIRDLVKNALRMRPDRVIVGECRGGETLDMLQAMNTGHEGSLSTVHSNTPRDTVSRLETLCLMSGLDLPIRVISKQISSAVNLIVQQARLSDGSRKITHITEVQGMEGDTLLLQDIFIFEQKGRSAEGKVIGRHRATGFRPKCVHEIESRGYSLPRNLFQPD
jgi:pilus assembly protein CpaF